MSTECEQPAVAKLHVGEVCCVAGARHPYQKVEVHAIPCADCDECAKLAYSDATTPGFFYSRCERHRENRDYAVAFSTVDGNTHRIDHEVHLYEPVEVLNRNGGIPIGKFVVAPAPTGTQDARLVPCPEGDEPSVSVLHDDILNRRYTLDSLAPRFDGQVVERLTNLVEIVERRANGR